MDICHITTVHPAKDPRIFYRMCRGLAEKKIQVALIAPETFPEESFLRPSACNFRLGKAARAQRVAIALKAALAEDADLYHFHDPELIPMALTLKAIKPSKAIVYDVHEDYPSMMLDKYWLPKWLRPIAAAGARIGNGLAGRFLDGIVVADPGVENDFKRSAPAKTLLYYNFPSLSLYERETAGATRPRADLVYLGGMSERSGIFVLFNALRILAREGIEPTVRLAGYTDGEKGLGAIREAIQRQELVRQIEFYGRIPHAQVPAWIRAGSIGLVLLQAMPKFMKNIPSKLFEYWACGVPVLASDLPPVRQFLKAGENGCLFSPASARELADRIHYLLLHADERQRMGRAGREMVAKRWNNESQIDGLVAFYEGICGQISRGTLRWHSSRRVPATELSSVRELPADSREP